MAGHNKWSKIKHRKKVVDARRSRAWTKCAKAIMVAAKLGGPDPNHNVSLRYAIDEARYANMPRDTIERAIKKGCGELGSQNFETVRYEGYAPGGVAVVVDALTDNRTRTAGDVRLAFSRCEGNLGTTGCVSYLFDSRGQIVIAGDANGERGAEIGDRVLNVALEAGALDVQEPTGEDEPWVILTEPTEFLRIKDAVENAGLKVEEASLQMVPQTMVRVNEAEKARTVLELLEMLEENDDVQKVYSNFAPPEDWDGE